MEEKLRKAHDELEQRIEERTAELQQSEERFRLVLSNSPVIVAHCDRDLRYAWIYNPHPDFRAHRVVTFPLSDAAGESQGSFCPALARQLDIDWPRVTCFNMDDFWDTRLPQQYTCGDQTRRPIPKQKRRVLPR